MRCWCFLAFLLICVDAYLLFSFSLAVFLLIICWLVRWLWLVFVGVVVGVLLVCCWSFRWRFVDSLLLCFRVWVSRSFIERVCFGSFVVDVVADGCLYLRLTVELLLLSQHFTELFGDFRCCVVDLVLTLADFRCWFVDCLLFVGCCRQPHQQQMNQSTHAQ